MTLNSFGRSITFEALNVGLSDRRVAFFRVLTCWVCSMCYLRLNCTRFLRVDGRFVGLVVL